VSGVSVHDGGQDPGAGRREDSSGRRRITIGFALAIGVVAIAAAAVVIFMMTGPSPGPNRSARSASTASADYIGRSWRLTIVAEGAITTTIPASVPAGMELWPDGQIFVNDGVNGLDGRFTKSTDGFEVRDVGTTLLYYGGKDPHRLAAIAALDTLAWGNLSGQSGPARDTVVSADRTRLVVQSGAFRLTFEPTTAVWLDR